MPAGEATKLKRVGGHPALDFANTATWDGDRITKEHLQSFADIVKWGRMSGLVDPRVGSDLLADSANDPYRSAMDFSLALTLRKTLRDVLEPRTSGLDAVDLSQLQDRLRTALNGARLVPRPPPTGGAAWVSDGASGLTNWLTLPLTLAASALLTGEDSANVRMCERPGCGWLFLDKSPGKARRWCAMEPCGNKMKARTHYRRHRRTAAGKDRAAGQ